MIVPSLFKNILKLILIALILLLIFKGFLLIKDTYRLYNISTLGQEKRESFVCTDCISRGYTIALLYFITAALLIVFLFLLPKLEAISANSIKNSLGSFKAFFLKYPEVIIFTTITIAAFISFHLVKANHLGATQKIEVHSNNSDTILKNKLVESKRLDSINLCNNLKQYYLYIDTIKKAKLELSKKFGAFVIICYSIGIFFVAMTGIIAFIITKRGWDHSSRIRKALLLSFAFYAIVFPIFPKLFNQAESFKTHFTDYNVLTQSQFYIFSRLSPYI